MSTPNPRLIGSTDAAAVLGLSKYKTPFDVARRILDDFRGPSSPEMFRGLALEPRVAELFSKLGGGLELRSLPPIERPKGRAWQRVSFDFETPEGAIVECKTANEHAYAADWTGEPEGLPTDYAIQVQVQLEALDREVAWVPVLVIPALFSEIEGALDHVAETEQRAAVEALVPLYLARGELRVYRVTRDRAVGAAIVQACASWWARHIVGGEPVQPAPSKLLDAWLAQRHPAPRAPLRDMTPEEERLTEAYEAARAKAKAAAEEQEAIAARIKAAIGDAEGVKSSSIGVATWRKREGSTDWKAIANEALGLLGLHGVNTKDIVSKHRGEPGRTLRVAITTDKAEEHAA
jgi:hypothetical protein